MIPELSPGIISAEGTIPKLISYADDGVYEFCTGKEARVQQQYLYYLFASCLLRPLTPSGRQKLWNRLSTGMWLTAQSRP